MEQSVALNYVGFIFSREGKAYFSLIEAKRTAGYRKGLKRNGFVISETSSIKDEEISKFLKKEDISRKRQYRLVIGRN
ncbi:MAG: hypothetical protein NT136_02235 [Candidatus Moranbacteria bacterium]|nr:hypothetical protein [Candidatus Moranbacteria bacterium]